nr:hypothetical protein [Tanacetum cinerariifolium]
MKNAGKFLKMKIDLDILNDETDGESSIQFVNKTNTFVELKYKNWANFLVNIEKTIISNSYEGRAKVSLDTAYAFIASQSSGSQIKYEDINQIDEDDIEEMDIKWNMALLSMRADKYWKKTGKKISIQGTDVAGFNKSKTECFNCHKMGHFSRECRAPRSQGRSRRENFKQGSRVEESAPKALMAIDRVFDNSLYSKACKKNTDSLNTKITDLREKLSNSKPMLYHYKLGLSQVEARLVQFKNQEIKFYEKIRGLDVKVESKTNIIESLTNELEMLKKEKEGLDSKLTGFQSASKDLDNFLGSQRPSPSIESKSNDLQNNSTSVSENGESTSSILSKPEIKFVKATDSPTVIKTNKDETVRRPSVKYGEIDFKLRDDTNVLLRTPRQHNMYSIDLNNIVPHKDLTCLVAKASADESELWHRRLGRLNFKTMNRFTWTFFLKTKDETSGILKNFIIEIENLKDLKVKFIRCDNGGEFRNKEMNDFCLRKRIKKEFNNARTPQQNGVAERRNRTLIEAARTMLDDAKLPVTFCAKAVNTACYVQNRVLVNKSQNKTPYDLFNGKFEAKGDEGYFIGYSMSSKAFRVFNKRTKRVEENLHVEFLENKLIEKGAGPNWLFDIDTLTNSMNYVLVVSAGTTSTNFSGTKEATSQDVKKDVSFLRHIALPNWFHEAHLETSTSNAQDACKADAPESSGNSNPTATSINPLADQIKTLTVKTSIPTVSSPVPTACLDDSSQLSSDTRLISKRVTSQDDTPSLDSILTLSNRFEDIIRVTTNTGDSHVVEANLSNMENHISASPTPTLRIHKDHLTRVRPIGTKWILKNKKDERGIVIRNKARLVAQRRTQEEGIDYEEMDVKSAFLYGTINEEVEFEALMHEKFQMSAMGELNFFLGLQVLQKKDGIFLSQDKYVGDISKKFGYSDVRSANTPMDKENPWGKDRTVKRIFRYLKGHPKLGIWYPKDSPFNLVAYSDSDYDGATQDRKSTTGGCQFLGRRLISLAMKKADNCGHFNN